MPEPERIGPEPTVVHRLLPGTGKKLAPASPSRPPAPGLPYPRRPHGKLLLSELARSRAGDPLANNAPAVTGQLAALRISWNTPPPVEPSAPRRHWVRHAEHRNRPMATVCFWQFA